MATAIDIAATMLGKGEAPDRASLQDYLRTGGANLDPVTTAWCAAFVNSSLKQAGLTGTGSNMARSFMSYGQAVDQPQRGDLAVFSRGDPKGPFGHVGFFDSINPDGSVRVLGGNQGNSVSYADYGKDRLLGFRRPGDAPASAGQAAQAPTAAPQAFGDLVSPASGAAGGGDSQLGQMGQIASMFLANSQVREQRKAEDQAVEDQRRAALFDTSGLWGMYA